MNIDEMKSEIQKIRSELKDFKYDNFAQKNPKSLNPEKLTQSFSNLLEKIEQLVKEASSHFPYSGVDHIFEKGKKLLNVKRKFVVNDHFEVAKANFLDAMDKIEANLEEEKKTPELSPSNLSGKKSQSVNLFISYYDKQILEEIKTVLGTLSEGEIAAQMDNLELVSRQQLNTLETIFPRIREISNCSSAIICLPPQDENEELISRGAYLDLGACLTRFPNKTLLIHQGDKLPEDLTSNIEVFHYLGRLDFKTGMGLARQILKVLKKD